MVPCLPPSRADIQVLPGALAAWSSLTPSSHPSYSTLPQSVACGSDNQAASEKFLGSLGGSCVCHLSVHPFSIVLSTSPGREDFLGLLTKLAFRNINRQYSKKHGNRRALCKLQIRSTQLHLRCLNDNARSLMELIIQIRPFLQGMLIRNRFNNVVYHKALGYY
jgi:hypothetical protein